MRTRVPVPDGLSVGQALQAVTILINRHQSLRTRFYVSESGEPRQVVAGQGSIRVVAYQVNDTCGVEHANKILEELCAAPFTFPEVSVRAAVTADGESPVFIVLCVLHMATDARGMEVIADDLTSILDTLGAGNYSTLSDELSHPSDRVAYEQSTEGLNRSIRSINYWKDQISLFGANSCPVPQQRPEWPLFKEVRMRSKALSAASNALCQRLQVSPAAIITGLAASLLCAKSEARGAGFLMFSHNRYDRRWSTTSGPLIQDFPIFVEVAGHSFPSLFRNIDRVNMMGSFYGQYDPEQLTVALARAAASAGFMPDISYAINVNTQAGSMKAAAKSFREVEPMMESADLTEGESLEQENMNFFLTVTYLPGEARALLRVNTRIFSISDIKNFLIDMERDCVRILQELE